MQVSKNFDIREFIPKHIWDHFGQASTWFVNEKAVKCAEFYKSFFTTYFKNKYGNDKVKAVLIVINNWHTGGQKQWSGLRTPEFTEGGKLSQHRFMNAFDSEIQIVFTDGTKKEAEYKEIHEVIHKNEAEFMANGVSRIESLSGAPGWLHTDFAWCPNATSILVVNP
jgi:hypothetical protein